MDTKEQASQPALQTLKEYAVITAAVLIMDIGIYVFKFPNNFSFGGVSGMAVVICRFLPFTASQINLFINLLLLLVGFAVLGRNFGVKTAYVTVLSSVLLNIFEKLFPMAHPLTDEIMLELCFAIILPALAAALLVTDLIVVILAFLIFDTLTGLCSVLGLIAKTLLIDKTIERMKLNKFFTIISNNPQPICDFITKDLNHSATLYDAVGAYSDQQRTVILTVVDVKQAVYLQRFIHDTEPTAFIAITKSSEIIGKGFMSYI